MIRNICCHPLTSFCQAGAVAGHYAKEALNIKKIAISAFAFLNSCYSGIVKSLRDRKIKNAEQKLVVLFNQANNPEKLRQNQKQAASLIKLTESLADQLAAVSQDGTYAEQLIKNKRAELRELINGLGVIAEGGELNNLKVINLAEIEQSILECKQANKFIQRLDAFDLKKAGYLQEAYANQIKQLRQKLVNIKGDAAERKDAFKNAQNMMEYLEAHTCYVNPALMKSDLLFKEGKIEIGGLVITINLSLEDQRLLDIVGSRLDNIQNLDFQPTQRDIDYLNSKAEINQKNFNSILTLFTQRAEELKAAHYYNNLITQTPLLTIKDKTYLADIYLRAGSRPQIECTKQEYNFLNQLKVALDNIAFNRATSKDVTFLNSPQTKQSFDAIIAKAGEQVSKAENLLKYYQNVFNKLQIDVFDENQNAIMICYGEEDPQEIPANREECEKLERLKEILGIDLSAQNAKLTDENIRFITSNDLRDFIGDLIGKSEFNHLLESFKKIK